MYWSDSSNGEFAKSSQSAFVSYLPSSEMDQTSAQDGTLPQNSPHFPVSYVYEDIHSTSSVDAGLHTVVDSDSFYTGSGCFGDAELYSMDAVGSTRQNVAMNMTEMVHQHYRGIDDASQVSCSASQFDTIPNGNHSASCSSSYSNSSTSPSCSIQLSDSLNSTQFDNASLYREPSWSSEQTSVDWNLHQDVPKTVFVNDSSVAGIHNQKEIRRRFVVNGTKQRDPHERIKNEMYNMYVLNAANREELDDRCDSLKVSLERTVATVSESSLRKRALNEIMWRKEGGGLPQTNRQSHDVDSHVCDQVKTIVARTRFFFHLFAKEFNRLSKDPVAPFRDPDQLTAHATGVSLALVRECVDPLPVKKKIPCHADTVPSKESGPAADIVSSEKKVKTVQTEHLLRNEGNGQRIHTNKSITAKKRHASCVTTEKDNDMVRKKNEVSVSDSPASSRPTQAPKTNETPDEPAMQQVFLVVKQPECASASPAERRWSSRIQNQQKVFYGTAQTRTTKKIKEESTKQGEMVDKNIENEQQSECTQSSPRRASQRSRCPRRAFSPSLNSEDRSLLVIPACRFKFIRKSRTDCSVLDDVSIEVEDMKTPREEKPLDFYIQAKAHV